MEKFTQTVAEYDSMTRLDAWYTTILLRIKKQLQVRIGEVEAVIVARVCATDAWRCDG